MAEAYLEALVQIHDRLAEALVSYVDDIEKQLNEKETSKYQAEFLHKQINSKLKMQYILKDCIQFQLNKKPISGFKRVYEKCC